MPTLMYLNIMIKANRSQENLAVGIVIIAVCFLATGGIFVKLSEVQPIATGAYRIIFALPLAYFWMSLEKQVNKKLNKPNFKRICLLTLAGIFLGLDLILWNISFNYTTVANANLLANMVPFVVIPLSYFVFKEKISQLFWVGLMITTTGVIILMSGKIQPSLDNFFGDGLAIGTALFYGLYILSVSRLRQGLSASTVMFYSSFGSLLVLIPSSIIFESKIIPTSVSGILPLIGLAVFSHIGGQGLLAYSLGKLSASLSSVLVLTQPVIAGIYALIIFKEHLSIVEVLGMFITLTGIYIAKRSHTKSEKRNTNKVK